MKKTIVLVTILLCATVYAAVEFTLTIPTEHTARVVEALKACENTHVSIHFQGSRDPNAPDEPDFTLDVDYRIDSVPGENSRDYAKRFIATMIRKLVCSYETKLKTEERQAAIDAIPVVDVNVPDAIIQ